MKVFLLKDIENIGNSHTILTVSDGYASNFLFPRKLAVQVTPENAAFYEAKIKKVSDKKEAHSQETSQLAQKIEASELKFKRKLNDQKKLFGALTGAEIADELAQKGIKISKNQVIFDKSIKTPGNFDVVIKLSSRLQPVIRVTVIGE